MSTVKIDRQAARAGLAASSGEVINTHKETNAISVMSSARSRVRCKQLRDAPLDRARSVAHLITLRAYGKRRPWA